MTKLPSRLAPILFGLFLSGFMSLIVSGIATARALGLSQDLIGHWAISWLTSWMIAFPVVLVVAPLVRRLVALICEAPGAGPGHGS